MKTTQYAVKVKTFYNIFIADIEQYFDFVSVLDSMECKQALRTIFIKSKYCSISAMNML